MVEADGGSRGNPGPAGYGALVRDADSGEVLAERREAIGTATNNVAEYRGLLAGLRAAAEIAADSIEVRMDSKLVVEQMSGRWKIKHRDLQPLAAQGQQLLRALPPTTFTWIPRERNAHADRLANEAMDLAAGRSPARTPSRPGAESPAQPPAATTSVSRSVGGAGTRPVSQPVTGRTSWTPAVARASTLLLRHGHTEHSAQRRFSGRNELPLNELGRREAAAAADRLQGEAIEAIVSSPLRRTRETADIVAERVGAPVRDDDDLAETDFGVWDGLTLAEAQAAYPAEMAAWTGSADVAPPSGESFAAVDRRVRRARRRLLSDHPSSRVLVVSHVTPIKLILAAALGVPLEVIFRIQLDPAGVSEVSWHDDGSGTVRLVNDVSHLR